MGRVAAAELLRQAQEVLQRHGLYGAVDVLARMRLLAELETDAPVLEAVPA